MSLKLSDDWEVCFNMPSCLVDNTEEDDDEDEGDDYQDVLREIYYADWLREVNSRADKDEDDEEEYFSSEHLGTSVPLSKLYGYLKDEFEHVSEIESLCSIKNIVLEDYYGSPAISYDGIMKVLDAKLEPKLNAYSSLKVWDDKLACDNHIKILTRIANLRANVRKAFEEQEKFDKWLEEEQEKLI